MYAVVAIGSRIRRSACGMNFRVFCASAGDAASAAPSVAACTARNSLPTCNSLFMSVSPRVQGILGCFAPRWPARRRMKPSSPERVHRLQWPHRWDAREQSKGDAVTTQDGARFQPLKQEEMTDEQRKVFQEIAGGARGG